jgi:hypothetical protein
VIRLNATKAALEERIRLNRSVIQTLTSEAPVTGAAAKVANMKAALEAEIVQCEEEIAMIEGTRK